MACTISSRWWWNAAFTTAGLGVLGNLWLYWSATFVGTSIVAFIIKGKFVKNSSRCKLES